MLMELDDLITILDDALDMQDSSKYHDALDNFYRDGILHDLKRYLKKQTKRVQGLEADVYNMDTELKKLYKQNKRYHEAINGAIKEFKQDEHQHGMAALLKVLEGEE